MKITTKFLMTIAVLLATMAMSVHAQEYFTDYGKYNYDNERKLNNLIFSRSGIEVLDLFIQQQTQKGVSPVYFDKTSNIIEIAPGEELSIRFDWQGVWMRNIAYVDWNSDKSFSTTDESERIGFNAAGGGEEMTKPINFTVPADQAEGEYRLRIMVAWFKPPHAKPNEADPSGINDLGGAVVDVVLKVTSVVPIFSTTTGCAVILGDQITINSPTGTTLKYTTDGTNPITSESAVAVDANTADVVINAATTVKAVAVNDNGNSDIAEANYTVLEGVTLGETYFVQFQRYNGDLTLEDMGEGVQIQSVTLSSGSEAQKWTISKGSKNGLYTLTSVNGRKIYYDGGFKAAANPSFSTDLRIMVSPNNQYTGLEIMRESSIIKAMNPKGGSYTGHNIGEWYIGDGGNPLVFVDREDLCHIELEKALETATTIKNNLVLGENFGQVTQVQKDAFVAVVNQAQQVYDANNGGYCAIRPTLTDAIALIKSQIVDLSKLQTSEPNKYRWLTIRSASSAAYATDKVISSNGRNVGDKFTYENVSSPVSDAQLFRFELTDDGTAVANIINKANGAYMSQNGAIVATAAENTGIFTITLLEDGLSFKITASTPNTYGQKDIHAQETGTHIVNWNAGVGSSSAWVFDFQKDLPKELTWTGSENTVWNNVNNWNPVSDPTNTDVIIPKTTNMPIASGNVSVNNLTIAPGASLTVDGDLTSANLVVLQGDATNGAATLISNNVVEGKMTYPLSKERTWYVSSPVNNSDVEALNSSPIYYYNETSGEYKNDATRMTNGVGYVIKPTDENTAMDFTGMFNVGDISVAVTKNSTSTDKFRGYNLIGNPYPAILDFDKVVGQNPNLINPTLWYNVSGTFSAYNASGGLGSPANTTKNIAPMQAFWVLYAADYTNNNDAANSQSGNLTINNAMRLSNSSEANPLKAPRAVENQILRLQLVDESNMKDETVIYFNAKAENAYGDYDSRKMFNEKGSLLYTSVAGKQLVINGMNTIPYDKEIALNLLIKESGNFTISANEFSNFNSEKVWLRDNLKGIDHDLLSGDYTFTADENTSKARFSIIFPRLDAPTGLEETLNDDLSLSVDNGNLQIRVKDIAEDAMVSVFNSLGQRVASQLLRGTVTTVNLSNAGVYVVKVMNGSEELTEKVVVR